MEELGAAAAVLAGAVLQSATGFGFAMLASPLLFALLEPRTAIGAMVLCGILLGLLILAGERRRPQPVRADALLLVACSVPGLLVGALALRVVPERVLTALVALAVLAGLALRLRGARAAPDAARRPWAAPLAGFTSGTLSTATGLSGPPVIFHLLGLRLSPARMRDTLATVFLAQGVLGLGALLAAGTFAVPGGLPLLFVAAVAGQVAGRRVFAALHPERYERVVLVVLACAALVALVSALA